MRWTAKLPALIAAIVLFIAGLFVSHSKWRYAALGALMLFCASGGFLYWSLTIKDWCYGSAWSSAFSPDLRMCLRQKGWFEF